jgi:hypothetical protein
MENHPIPQDITGFQFKLIGNMTVKQFAYLAAGIVLAWITIALPINISIRLLFAFIFSMIGVAFAFLPIQGRPLDIMFSHLMKALINPTQFVYQKSGARLFPASVFQPIPQNGQSKNQVSALSGEKLKAFLDSLPKKPGNKLDEKEMIFFQSLGAMAAPQAPTQPMPAFVQDHAFSNKIDDSSVIDDSIKTPKTPIEENDTEIQEEELEKEAKNLQDQLNQAKQQEQTQVGSANYDIAHAKVTELEQQLNESFLQKTELEKQLSTLKKQLESQKQIYKPSMAVSEKTETKNVRSIPREMGKSIGVLSAPEFPNLITGIIKGASSTPTCCTTTRRASGRTYGPSWRRWRTTTEPVGGSALRGLGAGSYRLSLRRRRDAPAARRGLGAQPGAHGGRVLPRQGPAPAVDTGCALVHALAARRRPRLQPARLAVGRGYRYRRRPVPPRLQPGAARAAVRPGRDLRASLRAGAGRGIAGAEVHEPWRLPGGPPAGYPLPVVDHQEERRVALDRYASATLGPGAAPNG